MTTAEMLAELREVLADELATYAWSDVRLLAYLNDGQDQFCQDTGFFKDTTTFTTPTVAGTASYALDARIIRVDEVYIGSRRLRKGVGVFPVGAEAVEPNIWQTDKDTGMLTLFPTPTSIVTLTIHAWRYPKADMTTSGGSPVAPEIPKPVQRACIEWAAWRAFGHHDAELQNTAEAKRHYDMYQYYVGKGRQLFLERHGMQLDVSGDPNYVV